jgi:hypothetical protein
MEYPVIPSKPLRNLMTVGGVLLAVGGIVAGIAVASAGGQRHSAGGATSSSAHAQALSREEAALVARRRALVSRHALVVSGRPRQLPSLLARNFGVFRRAVSGRARAAAGQFPGVRSRVVASWGLAVGDATEIPNSVGLNLWLVPGSTGTCLVWRYGADDGGSGDCVPNSMAAAGDLSPLMGLTNGDTIVMGLAPDTNTTVRLVRADGSSQSVPVSNNVYVVATARAFTSVTLRDSGGAIQSRSVPDGR